mmetsp:Transcript_60326/g.134417  ORF Transcript_60326/g.134417 Transcript_60326/m.134417 type:complete len:202 (-) Transcript_60326:1135-1740(-)
MGTPRGAARRSLRCDPLRSRCCTWASPAPWAQTTLTTSSLTRVLRPSTSPPPSTTKPCYGCHIPTSATTIASLSTAPTAKYSPPTPSRPPSTAPPTPPPSPRTIGTCRADSRDPSAYASSCGASTTCRRSRWSFAASTSSTSSSRTPSTTGAISSRPSPTRHCGCSGSPSSACRTSGPPPRGRAYPRSGSSSRMFPTRRAT